MAISTFQFFRVDFLCNKRELRLAASRALSGLLFTMHYSVTPGLVSWPISGYAHAFGSTVDQARAVLDELIAFHICDADTEDDERITITSRRMVRDSENRAAGAVRSQRYRNRNKETEDPQASRERNGGITHVLLSSSSSSSSISDLERLIEACVREHVNDDPRLVEIAVIETFMRRRGSAAESVPIKSVKYFEEEIRTMIKNSKNLSSATIDVRLTRRREQFSTN